MCRQKENRIFVVLSNNTTRNEKEKPKLNIFLLQYKRKCVTDLRYKKKQKQKQNTNKSKYPKPYVEKIQI